MNGQRGPAALGILYAEDFGRAMPKPRAAAKPPPAGSPPLTQADVDAACIRAVQAAQRAWAASAEDRRAEALASIAASLGTVRRDALQHADAVADGIAQTGLTSLAAALPHLCRRHGDAEVRALLARLAPLLAPGLHLVVRVHPELIATLAADLATLDDTLVQLVELRPANLPPGDIRLSWQDGRLVRDTAAICAALQDSLAEFGLIDPPQNATQPRSIERVQ